MFSLKQFMLHEIQQSNYFKASSNNPSLKRNFLRQAAHLVR